MRKREDSKKYCYLLSLVCVFGGKYLDLKVGQKVCQYFVRDGLSCNDRFEFLCQLGDL